MVGEEGRGLVILRPQSAKHPRHSERSPRSEESLFELVFLGGFYSAGDGFVGGFGAFDIQDFVFLAL